MASDGAAIAARPKMVMRNSSAAVTAALAMFISRYDPDVANALVAPLAMQIQTLAGDSEYWTARITWAALAMVEPRRVGSLIETRPEPSPTALRLYARGAPQRGRGIGAFGGRLVAQDLPHTVSARPRRSRRRVVTA